MLRLYMCNDALFITVEALSRQYAIAWSRRLQRVDSAISSNSDIPAGCPDCLLGKSPATTQAEERAFVTTRLTVYTDRSISILLLTAKDRCCPSCKRKH